MGRRIGINVVSLLPYSFGPGGLGRAVKLARRLGFDGVQAVPLRGYGFGEWGRGLSEESVISFEGAWNCGSLWEAVRRGLKLSGDKGPSLIDWVLFGGKRAVEVGYGRLLRDFPNSLEISHAWDSGLPVEMKPETCISEYDYVGRLAGVVWDTHHVRREGWHGEPRVATRLRDFLVRLTNRERIKLIHVHPTKEEMPGFLSGKLSDELSEMFDLLSLADCPVILEIPPVFRRLDEAAGILETLREELG